MGEPELKINPMSKHGVYAAGYTNNPNRGYQPFIDCFCDEFFADLSWEDVGRAFDEHLAEVKGEDQSQ